ncbi:MAG: molybdopterin-dependent oxidoreductase [Arhodomonas sp.]|nr:molybdopterin-dependent oxidoreductase [Arhodomonas sp.]
MEIGTCVGLGVHSELSGNIIDLCPVGALTNKPFRFRARAWEMLSHPSVSPHDPIGANVKLHHVGGTIKRVVPADNEAVNETWIADRDRYSYQGIYSDDRLAAPLIKINGQWKETDWETALEHTVSGLRHVLREHGPEGLGALVSPNATTEEMYLLGRLVRELGSEQHRSPAAPGGLPRRCAGTGVAVPGPVDRLDGEGSAPPWWWVATFAGRFPCSTIACARRACAGGRSCS